MNRLLASAIIFMVSHLSVTPHIIGSAGAAVSPGPELQVQDRGADGITLSFSSPFMAAEELALELQAAGEGMTWTCDGREIPAITRWVAVPSGHRVELQVRSARSNHFDTASGIGFNSAIRDPRSAIRNPRSAIRNPQSAIRNPQSYDPPEPAAVGGITVFRGTPIVPVTIYPVQLAGSGEGGVLNRQLELELQFVPDPGAAPTCHSVTDPPGSEPDRMLRGILLNPPRRDYDEPQLPYLAHILVLHQAEFASDSLDTLIEVKTLYWIDSLATWKRRMGYKVSICPIDYSQMNSAEIRQLIRQEYFWDVDWPISHLIIIGADVKDQQLYFPTYHHNQELVGDHFFSLMDDEDLWSSDICVGRIDVIDNQELAGAVNRSVLYESQPYNGGGEQWFTRAVVTAEDIEAAGFVASMVQLSRWVFTRLIQYGYTQVDTFYGDEGDVAQPVRSVLEEGRGLVVSRGWVYGCYTVGGAARVGRQNPFMIAITCQSHNRQVEFFRSSRVTEINGSIASLIMTWNTHTKGNNSVLGWCVRAIRYRNMHQPGWIQLLSKHHMYDDLHYERALVEGEIIPTLAIYRLMGDPSVNVFTTRPIGLEVERPAFLSTSSTGINVRVTSDGEAVPDAVVCIWQEDGIHLISYPGEDGWARFTFEPGELEEDTLALTVTRYNAYPYLADIVVTGIEGSIALEDIEFDDEDGLFGNGDTIRTTLTLRNNGDAAVNDVAAELFTEDPWVSFSTETLDVGDIPAGDCVSVGFDLSLHRASRAGRIVRIDVAVSAGDEEWSHAFNIVTSGHIIDIRQLNLGEGELVDRDSTVTFIPELRNQGDLPTPSMTATLVSLDETKAQVIDTTASYSALDPFGGVGSPTSGALRAHIDEWAIPGDSVRFQILLVAQDVEDGFRDTLSFARMIGAPAESDPLGPDEYGYICFDSGDEDWEKGPEYRWREINPDAEDSEFEGTRLELGDIGEDYDSSLVVPLDFAFRYYGQDFDTIVVNSNGWIAFGVEQSMFVHFRNWPIPGIQGPDAQVAVFWQDLINPNPDFRGVFYHYVEDEQIFIVEWSRMQVREGPSEDLLECQVILYNPLRYPTSTGDGDIKLQYKHVVIHEGHSADTKYFTIGIKNLDNTGGLQYAYWNQYTDACLPLDDEMAILFTVDVVTRMGTLTGRVVDAASPDRGLDSVDVRSSRGPMAVTDAEGNYNMQIAAGNDVITFSRYGYNTESIAVHIRADTTTSLDLEMTNPELEVSTEPITFEAQPGFGGEALLQVRNGGNGPLEFRLSRRYRDGSETEYAETWNVGISDIVDAPYIYGCQFIGDSLFVSGTIDRYETDDNYIYVIDREGGELRRFLQSSYEGVGFHDLAWDGEYLYGGERSQIFVFEPDGDLVHEIDVPPAIDLPDPTALAWNGESQTLFIANPSTDIFEMRIDGDEGEIVGRFDIHLPGQALRILGLAWNPHDEDGMPLYIMDWPRDDEHGMRLVKANPVTEEARFVANLARSRWDDGKGLTIGYDWERNVTSLASIADIGEDDTLRVYEIGPDCRFVSFTPVTGAVPADGVLGVHLIFDGTGLYHGETYELGLLLQHNAAAPPALIPVIFDIDSTSGVDDGDEVPLEFGLDEAYPNPFNAATHLRFTLDRPGLARLAVYDLSGRLVRLLVEDELSAGRHQVLFEPRNLATGIYFYRLESADRSVVQRMLLLR